jgi:hypothetical protein
MDSMARTGGMARFGCPAYHCPLQECRNVYVKIQKTVAMVISKPRISTAMFISKDFEPNDGVARQIQ